MKTSRGSWPSVGILKLVVIIPAFLALVTGCPSRPPSPPPGDGNVNDNINGNENQNDNDNQNTNDNGAAGPTFMGSNTCLTCHGVAAITGSDKSSFWDTGHPYKLNAVENDQPPQYPVTDLAGPPPGIEWTDVAFVIGGFRYKYRVVDNDGFIVLGPTAQYNFPSQGRSGYSNDDAHTAPDGTPGPWNENIGRKPYDCGKCHTTGYDADTPNSLGLEGLVGDWAFEGVHCEECHGAGSDHVAGPSGDNINGNPDTDTLCGRCHTRSADGIAASGGFVRHHEQWDEFSRSIHAPVMAADGCMTCHDVHKPLFDMDRLDAIQAAYAAGNMNAMAGLGSPPGIIKECTECHGSVTVTHAGPDECKVCHMAYTTKSAVAINSFAGDIRSHVWKIDDNINARMFTDADGNAVENDDSAVAFSALDLEGNPFITLDYACLQCHTDKDLQWAVDRADSIHGQ